MLFNNYTIFIYVLLFVILYNTTKHFVKLRVVKNVVILGANLLLLLTLVKEHSLIVIAVLSLLIFLLGRLLQKKGSRAILTFVMVLILCLFSIRNYEFVQELLSNSFLSFVNGPILSVQKVGLSYILFRFVHWLIESYHGTIKNSDFLTFLNYIFFFPSFLAGPIDTYKNFHYWIGSDKVKYQKSLFIAGITRIFIGAFKTFILVPLVIQYATDYSILLPDYSPIIALLLSLLAYSAYIYLDFSGYSDIAIGTAYLIGIKTPENFDAPYLAVNLSEFWKKWHMTFTRFLSWYVFKPIIKLLNKLINPKFRLLVSILGYLLTFAICGLWHGSTMNFLYWGIWHGVGLAIFKIWQLKIVKNKGITEKLYFKIGGGLITFSFVTIGWMFFHYSMEELKEIYSLVL